MMRGWIPWLVAASVVACGEDQGSAAAEPVTPAPEIERRDVGRGAVEPSPTPASTAPAAPTEPAPTPTETAPSPTLDETAAWQLDATRPVGLTSPPPLPGIEYWASRSVDREQFLARARAAGLRLDHEVEVSSTEQLLEALASNTVIVLGPGRFVFDDPYAGEDHDAVLAQRDRLSEHYDDGKIHDLHDLAIVGLGPAPAVILQGDALSEVLHFERIEGLALHNLALGHRPEAGECSGGVIHVASSSNVLIADVTMFGSGVEGLSMRGVQGLRLEDSVITDCSTEFSTIWESHDVVYRRLRVVGNDEDLFRGFEITDSDVSIVDSHIEDAAALRWHREEREPLLFEIDRRPDLGRWLGEEPRPTEPSGAVSRVELRNTVIHGRVITASL